MILFLFWHRASEEDNQSLMVPSSSNASSLRLSDNDSSPSPASDNDVDEQSISQMLNFNTNLTQAAEKST